MRRPAFLGKPVGKKRDVSLGDCLSGPDGFEFLGCDVKLETPPAQMRAFFREHGVERNVGCGEGLAQSSQFVFRRQPVQLKQVAEAADDGSSSRAQRVVHQLRRLHILMTHPQAFADLRHAAAVFRLAHAIDDGALQIADVNRLLLRDPVLAGPEIILWLDEDKPELGPMERSAAYPCWRWKRRRPVEVSSPSGGFPWPTHARGSTARSPPASGRSDTGRRYIRWRCQAPAER